MVSVSTPLTLAHAILQRYDFLSTGLGALTVTGYCVARGQDPGLAASITVTATIVALVGSAAGAACGANQLSSTAAL